eukprot:CAMPEP_0171454952 /NCGR_PEP_ID=MMETSP0945-20130129/2039_1 /TAXON_ID=109269 /ORGANISM="Vaucheria litorea, Strain CCMP2940" /LENGTH=120 /DNA_ID=CAMNT_0011980091 /DNA_START=61 /DNA_END=423 /DNA_ORIENTATION=+
MTNIYVVPLSHMKFPLMRTYDPPNANKEHKYKAIIGVHPTGWKFAGKKGKKEILSRRKSGSDMIIEAPYSEHSSFTELLNCVEFFNPRRIVPTVNCYCHEKVQSQLMLLSPARNLEQSEG